LSAEGIPSFKARLKTMTSKYAEPYIQRVEAGTSVAKNDEREGSYL
jgi:hypothetical protein